MYGPFLRDRDRVGLSLVLGTYLEENSRGGLAWRPSELILELGMGYQDTKLIPARFASLFLMYLEPSLFTLPSPTPAKNRGGVHPSVSRQVPERNKS